MSDMIGNIAVPDPGVGSTHFPLKPAFAFTTIIAPNVKTFQFRAANLKREQRFLCGFQARQWHVTLLDVTLAERATLKSFYDTQDALGQPFPFDAPKEDGTTELVTSMFANQPLAWESADGNTFKVECDLIEVITGGPIYPITATVTRFPDSTMASAMTGQAQAFLKLVHIVPKTAGYPDNIYLSDQRATVGGQLYLPRLLRWDGIQQVGLGLPGVSAQSDDVTLTFGNADRVMRMLADDVQLDQARVELYIYHINSGYLLQLWAGIIVPGGWQSNTGPEFTVKCSDILSSSYLVCPPRDIDRICNKLFDDEVECPFSTAGHLDLVNYPAADSGSCDRGYTTPNGCQAHSMKLYYNGVMAQPQAVRTLDNSTGIAGFGRNTITSVSLISDSAYGRPIPFIVTDIPMPVNAIIIEGRDEGDFYEALGIVGVGPLNLSNQSTLDGQYNHGYPGPLGFRAIPGTDPAGASDQLSLDDITNGVLDLFSAGVAALVIRRSDQSGLQLTTLDQHAMQAIVNLGWLGYHWSGPGARDGGGNVMTNPVWFAVNLLLYCLKLYRGDATTQETVFDVDAAVASAAICDLIVPRVVETDEGDETQWKFIGTVSDQRPLRQWLADILLNALGFYWFNFGKVSIGVRENASAISAYTDGNIIWRSMQMQPLGPSFSRLVANFADREYGFVNNSAVYQDDDYATELGGGLRPYHIQAQMNLSGTADISPATRFVITRGREEVGGVNAAERKAARRVVFKTTILGLDTYPGSVISITDEDVPGGFGHFRVERWKLNDDWTIEIQARSVTSSMYDLVAGPKPADVRPGDIPPETFPKPLHATWLPNTETPITGNALWGTDELSFQMKLDRLTLPDGSTQLQISFTGDLPVNQPDTSTAPSVYAVTQSTTGGNLLGGRSYYLCLCLRKSDNSPDLASNIVPVFVPSGTNTNKITLANLRWPAGTFSKAVLFASIDDPSVMSEIQEIDASSLPSSIDFGTSAFNLDRRTYAPPNSKYSLLRPKVKRVNHPGVIGEFVSSVGPNVIVCDDLAELPDDYSSRTLTILSRDGSTVPIADFEIMGYDGTTGTFTLNPDPSGIVAIGDVFIVNFKATFSNTGGVFTIQDTLIRNSLFPAGVNSTAIGDIIRILRGPGRGQHRNVIAAAGDTYTIDADWDSSDYPDSTSVWEREEQSWTYGATSTNIVASKFGTKATLKLSFPQNSNLALSPLLCAVGLVGSDGVESDDAINPMRMLSLNSESTLPKVFPWRTKDDPTPIASGQLYRSPNFGLDMAISYSPDGSVAPKIVVHGEGIVNKFSTLTKAPASVSLTVTGGGAGSIPGGQQYTVGVWAEDTAGQWTPMTVASVALPSGDTYKITVNVTFSDPTNDKGYVCISPNPADGFFCPTGDSPTIPALGTSYDITSIGALNSPVPDANFDHYVAEARTCYKCGFAGSTISGISGGVLTFVNGPDDINLVGDMTGRTLGILTKARPTSERIPLNDVPILSNTTNSITIGDASHLEIGDLVFVRPKANVHGPQVIGDTYFIGNTPTLVDSFGVNGLAGKLVVITGGTGAGTPPVPISGNDDHQIFTSVPFEVTPDDTSEFDIIDTVADYQNTTDAQTCDALNRHNPVVLPILIDNAWKTYYVSVRTADVNGNESKKEFSPFRELFTPGFAQGYLPAGSPGQQNLANPSAEFFFGIGTDGGPADLVVGATTNIIGPVKFGGRLYAWDAVGEVAGVGADIQLDVLKWPNTSPISAAQSVFGSTPADIPAGQTTEVGTGFNGVSIDVAAGDVLQGKVLQVGSTTPGKRWTLNLYWKQGSP